MKKNRFFTESNIYYPGIWFFLGVMCSRTIYHTLSGPDAYLSFVTDDFYYYFLPAKNFVLHGISSFDGITITNGYHPLWFIVISAFYAISLGNEQLFFILLSLVSAACGFMVFHLLWKWRSRDFPNAFSSISAVIASILICGNLFIGMEITIAIPIFIGVLFYISSTNFNALIANKRVAVLGFLSSLLILSRLDTVLLIVLFLAILPFIYKVPRQKIAAFYFYFCLGGILLPIYFAINLYFFGTILTVSSLAKFIKTASVMNWYQYIVIARSRDGFYGLLLLPFGIILLFLRRKKMSSGLITAIALAFAFPVLFYSLLIYKTDWFIFRWYLYPLPVVSFLVLSMAGTIKPLHSMLWKTSIAVLSTAIIIGISMYLFHRDTKDWSPHPHSIYIHSKAIKQFASTHPGIYAMGDRAGLTAYILDVPIVQLEGLACDMSMYHFIKTKSNLAEVLDHYNVDYLIESAEGNGLVKKDSCYLIEEPHTAQSGANSAKMIGIFHSDPVFLYQSNTNDDTVKTMIFQVKNR